MTHRDDDNWFDREFAVCFANQTIHYRNRIYDDVGFLIALLAVYATIFLCLFLIFQFYPKYKSEPIQDTAEVIEEICLLKGISHSCPILRSIHNKKPEELEERDLRQIAFNENKSRQESSESYCSGGYMPLTEGDILDETYEVIRKLGFGHFSTVWLCKNKKSDKCVAIKISKSQVTDCLKDEIGILELINSADRSHFGYPNVIQMLGYFRCGSVNGSHLAIVLEPMGPCLLHLIQESNFEGIHLPCVKTILKQVFRGLAYLHNACKVIHTDIKPENILIKVKDSYFDNIIDITQKFDELHIPFPRTYVTSNRWYVESDPWFYENRTKSCPQDSFSSDLSNTKKLDYKPKGPMYISTNIEVKIGDLGNALSADANNTAVIQTRQYRALEVILQSGYSCPADIWSVGCLAYELATGEFLFYPKIYDNTTMDMDHLALIWEALDGIPEYIIKTSPLASKYFGNGKLKHIDESKIKVWRVEDVLLQKYNWKKVDAIPFASFIESLVEPDPSLRATALEALGNNWLNDNSD